MHLLVVQSEPPWLAQTTPWNVCNCFGNHLVVVACGRHVWQGERRQQKRHENRVHEGVTGTGRTLWTAHGPQLQQKRQTQNQHHDHHHSALTRHSSWVCSWLYPGPQGVPVGIATEVLLGQRVRDHPHPAMHLELRVMLGIPGVEE